MKTVAFLRPMALAMLVTLPSYARAESPAALVADGQPWTSTTPEGRKMNITFFPDGRAKMKAGIISRNLTWQPTEDGLCMIGTPRGDACMRLEQTPNGFIGYRGDERVMTLSR